LLIETFSLTKRYGTLAALDDCSLGIRAGEVFGLLGPNGAGKTTLLRLLLGYLRPTSGRAVVDGLDCVRESLAVRGRVAYLPGEARLFRSMRGHEVLSLLAGLRPGGAAQHKRSLAIAERLELDTSRRVAMMSTGMRQKLALAATLAADTPIVILDEPTANLDPTVRHTVLAMVREAKAGGRTVVFSSHVLAETEEACDRVAVLRSGKLVHVQSIQELRRRHRIYLRISGAASGAIGDGEFPRPDGELGEDFHPRRTADGWTVVDTAGELRPLLGWLATLALDEIRIEPLGLRAVYERFHPSTNGVPVHVDEKSGDTTNADDTAARAVARATSESISAEHMEDRR
jgi:ABC-2 type transport system ATP-binding protein